METKSFIELENLEIKSGEDGNSIIGYGSTWGNEDLVGDIIEKNAFAKSLASGKKIKMLWMHDWKEPIGVWTNIVEDEKGLRVEGKFSDTAKSREVKNLLKDGAIDGLSVGFRVDDYEYRGDNRVIKSGTLREISIVSIPCNEQALITSVKSAVDMTEREFEKSLRDAFDLSRTEAKSLIAGGFAAMKGLRDADNSSNKENLDVKTDEVIETEEVVEEIVEAKEDGITAEEFESIKSLLNSIIGEKKI